MGSPLDNLTGVYPQIVQRFDVGHAGVPIRDKLTFRLQHRSYYRIRPALDPIQGLLTLIRPPLLRIKNRQSRREESGLARVDRSGPNERRATTSGDFLASTRRAGAIFPSSGVISRLCRITTQLSFCLAGAKNGLQQR